VACISVALVAPWRYDRRLRHATFGRLLRALDIPEFLACDAPIIDVRSPGEFAHGHIPGAHGLPLFSDEERAVVGTLYKRQGRDAAVLEGLRFVGPRMAALVEQARSIAPQGKVRVHCWRGGERSGSVAWLLDKAGFAEVRTLRGGYKAFRQHVLDSFNRTLLLQVVGGYTGSGKTELLALLAVQGEQVLDLEALASHKGSSFGMLGQGPQPTTEHFENLLWSALARLDPAQPIWCEDESVMIGRVKVPDAFFHHMRTAPLFFAHVPVEQRVERLVQGYGGFPKEQLAAALERIRKRMGPQHCKAALEALDAGDLAAVARATLVYYDKAYQRSVDERAAGTVVRCDAPDGDLRTLLPRLIAHVRT
jgi:tRNA 2-selenouridine synthase